MKIKNLCTSLSPTTLKLLVIYLSHNYHYLLPILSIAMAGFQVVSSLCSLTVLPFAAAFILFPNGKKIIFWHHQ